MAGGLRAASRSRWRSRQLLILCYHGFSREDEHLWNPELYVPASHLEARLRFLVEEGYQVLPLGEGLGRLEAGTLPPRAVAITVDDGNYDFYAVAYPMFKHREIPVTLFVSTYYVFDQRPVFDVAISYLAWKGLAAGPLVLQDPLDRSPHSINSVPKYPPVVARIRETMRRAHWSAAQKHQWLERFAIASRLDWKGFVDRRLFALMDPNELASLDPAIVDVQLHTHRHRVPEDRDLFLREICDNRQALADCGFDPAGRKHFCYPSGVHRRPFLQWLAETGVTAAVTCTPGLASRRDQPLLLPRFIDGWKTSDVEFEGWTSGFRHFVHRPTRAFAVDA